MKFTRVEPEGRYSEQVMEHCRRPRNRGPLAGANGVGRGGGGECSDTITVRIRVEDERIVEIRFEADGCEPTVACGSALTELAAGKDLDEASLIAPDTLSDALGGLPREYQHCAQTAVEALGNAMMDYVVRSIEGT